MEIGISLKKSVLQPDKKTGFKQKQRHCGTHYNLWCGEVDDYRRIIKGWKQ